MSENSPGQYDAAAGETPTMNLKQAAIFLNVHYMTAYRYVRQGLLFAQKEGTQWRVARGDLDEFVCRARAHQSSGAGRSLTTVPRETQENLAGTRPGHDLEQAATPSDGATRWDQRLVPALLSGDETSAWKVIERTLAAGHSPAYCYLDVIAMAMSSVGERWAKGELESSEPHLASAVAIRLVARLGARFRRPGRSRGTVVFGAPSGEFHILPIAIVADLIRLQGYDVLELGPDVAPAAFVAAARRTPRLICVGVGVARPELVASAQDVVDALRELDQNVPIVIGGLATKDLVEGALRGVTAIAESGHDAVALIESFAASRAIRRAL